MCPLETHGQEDEQKEEASGEDDSRCVNHYGGGTEGRREGHRGAEGLSLMRWKRSNWHALFLRPAEATLGPDRKAESQTGSS